DSQVRRRDAGDCVDSSKFFCLAGYRSLSRSVGAPMASWLGAGFAGICCSLFPDGWHCEFWIFHDVWRAVAENVEWHHLSVFSVLVNKLRLVDSFGPGARGIGWLAYLEIRMALG